MEIKIPEPKQIKTNELKIDGQNPNVMSKNELETLKKNIIDYENNS